MFRINIISKIFFFVSIVINSASYSQCSTFQHSKKIVAPDRWTDDYFGSSVAISGNFAIVGANGDSKGVLPGSLSTHNAGSAYIYEKDSSGIWSLAQKIIASDRRHNDNFGNEVSISGNYAVVAARANDEDTSGANFLYHSGAAYVYERDSSGVWIEKQKLVASDRAREDFFGYSVSISGDFIFVGSPQEDEDSTGTNTIPRAGSCYVFERDSQGVWHEVQKLTASDRSAYNGFAGSVSVSGNFGVVTSSNGYDTSGNYFAQAGACYMFERQSSGIWEEVQKIFPAYRVSSLYFGYDVSLSGNNLVVSSLAYLDSNAPVGSYGQGACFIFEQDSSGIWQEKQLIRASDKSNGDYFGRSISISGDYLIVAAPEENEDELGKDSILAAGSSYLFKKDFQGNWVEQYKLVASDRGFSDRFGWGTAIEDSTVIISTIYDEKDENGLNPLTSAGSIYIYDLKPTVFKDSIVMYACDSFTSPTGKIWKVNGIYYDTITQLNGCDTIMTYNLIMNALMRDSLILSGCDTTVYWRGNTYQNTVVISDTVTSGGCDSVFTLDLTIYSSVTVTRKDTACERIQLPGGLFVTNSGTYRDTFGRSNGCDSIIVSEVIVNQPSSSIHTLTVCNTMTSPTGKVWISDGTYYDTLINSSGCDSLLTFNLTFSQIYRDTINHTQCNGNYIWRGTTYVVSSVISETVTTGVCDSIFTLDLTINSSVTVTRKDTACERIQLPNGLFVTSSGTYRDTFARSNGCDSIIVSEIIVNQPSSSIQTLSVCNAMNSPSGKVWNTTGTFFDTIVNSSGCDSLMRFNLTVNSVNRLVSIQGVTITANQGAAAYQWLDCSNGYLKITGETNQSYSPTVNGTYAVEITQNECVDTSVCSIIKSVAIDENDKQDLFEIFPNPTSQIVHVLSLEKSTGTKIYIYNSIGKIVLEVKFPPYKNKTTIDVSTLENGMYIIALESKKGVVGKRIVISK